MLFPTVFATVSMTSTIDQLNTWFPDVHEFRKPPRSEARVARSKGAACTKTNTTGNSNTTTTTTNNNNNIITINDIISNNGD